MFEIDRNLQMVIILFMCCTFILYKQKPSMMFDNNGKIKEFGAGPDKTITPFWLVSLVIGLLIYLQFTVRGDDYV